MVILFAIYSGIELPLIWLHGSIVGLNILRDVVPSCWVVLEGDFHEESVI